jgi:hypothetical protein
VSGQAGACVTEEGTPGLLPACACYLHYTHCRWARDTPYVLLQLPLRWVLGGGVGVGLCLYHCLPVVCSPL